MQRWDDRHMDGGWEVAMVFGMLGTWLLVALALWWVIRSSTTPKTGPTLPPSGEAEARVTVSAERILAERLARGEIDPDEYGTRMQALASGSTQP